jgi:hypothetical protein
VRESAEQLTRYAVNKRSSSKENRLAQTVEHRNYSNEYLPAAHQFADHIGIKNREFSSSKNCRKESHKPVEADLPLQRSPLEAREKRPHSSKNFIGCKLKKKLHKYLLFLSLVNYSLRLSYQRSEPNRYRLFVGKGNNSKLVRTLFASRFWWELTDHEADAHLVWYHSLHIGHSGPRRKSSGSLMSSRLKSMDRRCLWWMAYPRASLRRGRDRASVSFPRN